MIWGLSCCAASPQMCARSGASTPRLNGASRCPYRGFGGRRSSRNRACFGLHPLKRGTRLVFRYGRTVAPFPSVPSSVNVGSSLPSVMFAAKSAPRRIRRAPRGGPRGGDPPLPLQPPRGTQRAADKPPLHRGIGLASPDAGVIADLRALGRGTALDSARVAAATSRRRLHSRQ